MGMFTTKTNFCADLFGVLQLHAIKDILEFSWKQICLHSVFLNRTHQPVWVHVRAIKTLPKPLWWIFWNPLLTSVLVSASGLLLPTHVSWHIAATKKMRDCWSLYFTTCLRLCWLGLRCKINKMGNHSSSNYSMVPLVFVWLSHYKETGSIDTFLLYTLAEAWALTIATCFYLLSFWRVLVSWGRPETTAALTVAPPAGSYPLLGQPPADLMTARGLNPLSAAGANWYWSRTN